MLFSPTLFTNPLQHMAGSGQLCCNRVCAEAPHVPHKSVRVWSGLLQLGCHIFACHPHCIVSCIQYPLGGSLLLELFYGCLYKTYLYRFNGIHNYCNSGCTSIMQKWQDSSTLHFRGEAHISLPCFLILDFQSMLKIPCSHLLYRLCLTAVESSIVSSACWKV